MISNTILKYMENGKFECFEFDEYLNNLIIEVLQSFRSEFVVIFFIRDYKLATNQVILNFVVVNLLK